MLQVPEVRRPLLLHVCLLRPVDVPEMRGKPGMINPSLGRRDRECVVRIRRRLKERRYLQGKRVYKHQQLELTIPSKFKDIVEPFLYTDLKIETRREGNSLIIHARPVEGLRENV